MNNRAAEDVQMFLSEQQGTAVVQDTERLFREIQSMSVDKQNEAIAEAQNTVTGTQQALIASAEAQQAHDLEV